MAAPAVAAAAPVHFIAPTAFSVYRQVAGAIESESVDLALVDRLRAALLTNDKTFGTTVTQVLKIPEKYACASVHGATLTIANVYNCLLAGASPIGPACQALPSCFELQGTECESCAACTVPERPARGFRLSQIRKYSSPPAMGDSVLSMRRPCVFASVMALL